MFIVNVQYAILNINEIVYKILNYEVLKLVAIITRI